jgi:hypothetical protein
VLAIAAAVVIATMARFAWRIARHDAGTGDNAAAREHSR